MVVTSFPRPRSPGAAYNSASRTKLDQPLGVVREILEVAARKPLEFARDLFEALGCSGAECISK